MDFVSFYGFVLQVQENLQENEKRLFIHKQVQLKTSKYMEEIRNMIFDLELDISEMDRHIFSAIYMEIVFKFVPLFSSFTSTM